MDVKKKTVLIVDDEPANIDLLKGLLPQNLKIKAALNGELAIKLCAKQAPDLIFMDLVMPGLSGFETITKLRAMSNIKNTPIIVISGNKSPEDETKAKALDVSAYLVKPLIADELSALFKDQLRSLKNE